VRLCRRLLPPQRCLTYDAARRITLVEVFQHPWWLSQRAFAEARNGVSHQEICLCQPTQDCNAWQY
jgi:hypothetical protein